MLTIMASQRTQYRPVSLATIVTETEKWRARALSHIVLRRSCRSSCPCRHEASAVRESHSAAAVRPSFPASTTSCRFLLMGMRAIPTSMDCAASNALHPHIGRVMRLTPLWSCSTLLFTYFTCRMMIGVSWASLYLWWRLHGRHCRQSPSSQCEACRGSRTALSPLACCAWRELWLLSF